MFIGNKRFQAAFLAIVCALSFPTASPAFELPALTSVGVNRPYKNSWVIYESSHFRAYVRNRQFAPIAEKALSILENERANFLLKTGFESKEKISVFLYKNMNDYRASNIGRDYLNQNDLGFDDPMKFRLGFPMNKSSRNFKWALKRRLISLYFFQNLFGDSKSVTRFVKLAWRSQWISEGLNGFYGGVNLPIMRMMARDAIRHNNTFDMGQLHWFGYLRPEERGAAEAQSIALFHYISKLTDSDRIKKMFLDYRNGFSNNDYLKKFTGLAGDALFLSWIASEKSKMKMRDEPGSFSERLTPTTDKIASFTSPRPIPGGKDFLSISNVDVQPEIYRFSNIDNEWRAERLIGWNRLISVSRIRKKGTPLNVSHDGRHLFFFGDYGATEYLFRIDLASGQLERFEIPTDDAYSPSVSPDGTKIVFTGIKNGRVNLYIWEYETGELKQLTDTPEDEGYPTWSPGGKVIAYAKEIGGQWDLAIISPDGKHNGHALTSSARDEIEPAWSDDEGVLLFSASEEEGYQLYSLNVMTGESKVLTNTQGGAFRPAPFKGGVIFEQYENIRSTIRWAKLIAKSVTTPDPFRESPPDRVAGIKIKESDSGSTFTRSFSLPIVLASAGDETSNNELLWMFGVKSGVVSQGVTVGNARAFLVPQAHISYVNKFNRFDISANLFYQSRDLTDQGDEDDDASSSSFSEREKYGGSVSVSFSPTANITFGAGYTGFMVNKRRFIKDDYKNYFDSGVFVQLEINHLVRYNLYPEYGYFIRSQYAYINELFGADNSYGIYHNNFQGYLSAFEKVVAGLNVNYDFSDGDFPTFFDLGWQEGLKGVELNKYEGTHRLVARATLQRPLFIDSRFSAGYSTLRDLRMILFADMGAVANNFPLKDSVNTYRKSVGIHVRFDIYWLQSFGVPIGIYYASEVGSDHPDSIVSITTGLNF